MPSKPVPDPTGLVGAVLHAFDDANGVHPGFRPAHAKGILLSGVFTPSAGGQSLTCATHVRRDHTPVTVRLSDFAGAPSVADNGPDARPHGIAIRFHLAEHVHTDIIAHSVDGFPTRTAEEFVEFLNAVHASANAPPPTPIESYLATHPAALKFVQAPKPVPASFADLSFFAVNAYRFTNEAGRSRYGRYRIRPTGHSEHLDESTAARKSSEFLFDEIRERIARKPVSYRILVQLAGPGDAVDDATASWPEDRAEVEFGKIELTAVSENNDAEQRHIIFDPIPRLEGIEPSADPMLQARADIYLASGRRRREAPRTARAQS